MNKIIRFLGYICVYIMTLGQSYFASLAVTGTLLSVFCSLASVFGKLPRIMEKQFWTVYLICAIPLAVVFFIIVVVNAHKMRKKD